MAGRAAGPLLLTRRHKMPSSDTRTPHYTIYPTAPPPPPPLPLSSSVSRCGLSICSSYMICPSEAIKKIYNKHVRKRLRLSHCLQGGGLSVPSATHKHQPQLKAYRLAYQISVAEQQYGLSRPLRDQRVLHAKQCTGGATNYSVSLIYMQSSVMLLRRFPPQSNWYIIL